MADLTECSYGSHRSPQKIGLPGRLESNFCGFTSSQIFSFSSEAVLFGALFAKKRSEAPGRRGIDRHARTRTRPASASSAKMSSSVALLSAPARLHVIARRRRSTRGVRCAAKKKEGETSVSRARVASETDVAIDERARGRFRTERPFKDPPRDDATVLGDSVIPVRHPDASWFVCRTRRDGLSSTTLDGSRRNHNRHPCFLDDSETTPLQATSGSTPRTRQPR